MSSKMNNSLLVIIVFLAVYPIIMSMIMPSINKKRMKLEESKRDIFLESLKIKDKVVTISGIYGTIRSIQNNIVKLEIAKNVEIEIDKAGIMGTLK